MKTESRDDGKNCPAMDGMLRELSRGGEKADHVFVRRVMKALKDAVPMPVSMDDARRYWRKVFGGVLAKAAMLILSLATITVGIFSLNVFRMNAEPTEIFLYAHNNFSPDRNISMRVFVRNGVTMKPDDGRNVKVEIKDGQDKVVATYSVETDRDGIAIVDKPFPRISEGEYVVSASPSQGLERVSTEQSVRVKRAYKCMLSTDKPVYQPGHTMHIRTLTMESSRLCPANGMEIKIEVFDPKGNKVFRKKQNASKFGLASVDFTMADQVLEGDYKVKASVADVVSEKIVEVKRYVLPKFDISTTIERGYYGAGDVIRGTVKAIYNFGKPVSGASATVTLSDFVGKLDEFAVVKGKTDESGSFEFQIALKDYFAGTDLDKGDAFVNLAVSVEDSAGHKESYSKKIVISKDKYRIELFPENGRNFIGLPTKYYVYLGHPDGSPAKARITFGERGEVVTAENGMASITLVPEKNFHVAPAQSEENTSRSLFFRRRNNSENNTWKLLCKVSPVDGRGEDDEIQTLITLDAPEESFLLSTDKSVYEVGDTVQMEILDSSGNGLFFVDIVRNNVSVLMKSIRMENGKGICHIDLDKDLAGTLQLHTYAIKTNGSIVSDLRLIQVNDSKALMVDTRLDKPVHRPGENCVANFAVRDESGKPVAAALSLSVVDQAVFSMCQMHPGFERVYFLLQEELLKPKFQIKMEEALSMEGRRKNDIAFQNEAGMLLSNKVNTNLLRTSAGAPYGTRKNIIEKRKEVLRANLLLGAAYMSAALLAFLALPAILFGIQRTVHNEVGEAEFIKCTWFEWSSVLSRITWEFASNFFALLVLFTVFLIGGFIGLKWDFLMGTILLTAFLLPIFLFKRLKGDMEKFFNLSWKMEGLHKVLYLCFWAYPAFAVSALFSVLFCLYRPGDMRILPVILILSLLFAVKLLAIYICGVTSYSSESMLTISSARHRGRGLGAMMGNKPWAHIIFGAIMFAPVFIIFFFYLLIPLALFMPHVKIIECLGGDGGSSSSGGGDWNWGNNGLPAEAKDVRFGFDEDSRGVAVASPRIRKFFPETLLWKPEIITDEKGLASIEFPTADSITTWKMSVGAVSEDGRLGAGDKNIVVFQDFFADIDFPARLTQNDSVSVPVVVYNYMKEPQRVRLLAEKTPFLRLDSPLEQELFLQPGEVGSAYFTVVAVKPGICPFTIKAFGENTSDAIERKVEIVPDGKKVSLSVSESLIDGKSRAVFEIPEYAVMDSERAFVKLYAANFAQVVDGMDSILAMPYGCFEQTSSITYPNILALEYMRKTKRISPEIEMKAVGLINTGYQRLLSFEVNGGGFEWFGKAPANIALSAYALMEFCDMKKVYENVDDGLIDRTRSWLMHQMRFDGICDSERDRAALGHSSSDILSSYVLMALVQSGAAPETLSRAFDRLSGKLEEIEDPYVLALCANAFIDGKRSEAGRFLSKLIAVKNEDERFVWWKSSGVGVTYSRGDTHDIETTALATQAMMKSGGHFTPAGKALRWLISRKQASGHWGSTQATIQALRALVAGTGCSEFKKPYSVELALNGKNKKLDINQDNYDVVHLISLDGMLSRGQNKFMVETAKDAPLSYQLIFEYYVAEDEDNSEALDTVGGGENNVLKLEVKYDRRNLRVNDVLGCNVIVENRGNSTIPMVLIDVGIPPGFAVRPERLDSLVSSGKIERWENPGQQVIIYLRRLDQRKTFVIPFEMIAKYPIRAKTPASKVYEYYRPENSAKAEIVNIRVEK